MKPIKESVRVKVSPTRDAAMVRRFRRVGVKLIAEHLGIDQSNMSRFLSGTRSMSSADFKRASAYVAKVLDAEKGKKGGASCRK